LDRISLCPKCCIPLAPHISRAPAAAAARRGPERPPQPPLSLLPSFVNVDLPNGQSLRAEGYVDVQITLSDFTTFHR